MRHAVIAAGFLREANAAARAEASARAAERERAGAGAAAPAAAEPPRLTKWAGRVLTTGRARRFLIRVLSH
ncbi:MAG TPA: hypothetical protein VGC06_28150 [Actinomycetes bacterium]